MSRVRLVPLDVSQVATIERVGEELLRQGDPRAAVLLAVVLQWRTLADPDTFSKRVESDERALTVLRGGLA